MKKIIIYGTGSYVLGNEYINPVILPSVLKFMQTHNVKCELIFIKKTNKGLRKIKSKIDILLNSYNININYNIFTTSKLNIQKFLNKFKTEDIFCSIICTPDHEHYEIALNCLKKSINIIVVKPLVLTVKENQNLIDISKKNNCIGFVDYHKRLDNHSKLIKKYNNTHIKDLYSIDINYSQKKIVSCNIFDWVDKSNILNYLGSHYIDFVSHTSGFSPTSVMAVGIKKYLLSKKINTFDSITCLVKWKKGKNEFIMNLKTNWIDPLLETSMSDQKVIMYYTNSKIISDQKNRGFYISSDVNNFESINPDFNQKYNSISNNSNRIYEGYGIDSIFTFLELIQKKLQKVKINYQNYPNIEQSILVSKVLEGASKSLKNNSTWVKI